MSRRIRTSRRCIGAGLCLIALHWSIPVSADSPDGRPRSADNEPAVWTRIETGGETGCALGTPYGFFHRDGTEPERLLVYFQGGGACWSWVSCSGLFDTRVDTDELSGFRGIFDTANPENPFRFDEVVFVPYCTGDVHVGDASHRYGDDPAAQPIAHRGYRNVGAVLDWLSAKERTPEVVVVAGTSAGAYGALFYAPEIARRFPKARIVMLGDSGVPLLADDANALRTWGAYSVVAELWGAEPAAEDDRSLLLEAYIHAARIGERGRLAQITSDQDAVQGAFYLVSGSTDWRKDAYTLLRDVGKRVPSFRTFVVEGSDHGLLPTDSFYAYEADGVPLHEWVTRLVTGDPVRDVRCAQCRLDEPRTEAGESGANGE